MSRLTQIVTSYDPPNISSDGSDLYLRSLEAELRILIPQDLLDYEKHMDDPKKINEYFSKLKGRLPIISYHFNDSHPFVLTMSVLSPSNYTHGMGRYICDVTGRWLLPGRQLPLVHVNSLAFSFAMNPNMHFFFHGQHILIQDAADVQLIKSNIDKIVQEIRLNILTVRHVRSIISEKALSLEQRKIIIQEYVASILGKTTHDLDYNVYDSVQQLINKFLAEEKVTQIKEHIAPLLRLRPQVFERNLYYELQTFFSHVKDSFLAERSLKHLTRIIGYTYLFHKMATHSANLEPNRRHLSIKVLPAKLINDEHNRPVLALILSINLLQDNEIFEERHLMRAISTCVPKVNRVKGSFIEYSDAKRIKTLYLEISKPDYDIFTQSEIALLKRELPTEVKTRIESVINPVFMPKNEEEVMRNILTLSKQLKYVQDIPQCIITFQKQTNTDICFTVILLRLIKPGDPPLRKLMGELRKKVTVVDSDHRNVGMLRKRYPKEANVLEINLNKKKFLRKDFSVDLYEARRKLYQNLTQLLGDIRDYNGGMISKQNESLGELSKLLIQANVHREFLVENFFYSLSPTYMQSILPPQTLKKMYIMLLKATDHDYSFKPYFVQMQIVDQYCILMLGAINPSYKDYVTSEVEKIDLERSSLTTSFVHNQDISCVGYIYKFTAPADYEKLMLTITGAMRVWQSTLEDKGAFDPVTPYLEEVSTR